MNLPTRRLLVVNGTAVSQDEWRSALDAAGFAGASFVHPEKALTTLRHGAFDLVLIDEALVDDYSAASLAIEIRDQLGMPCVFVGRAADPADLHRMKEADPLGFISLPWSMESVRAQLELAFHRRAQEEERARMLPGRLLAHERLADTEAMLPICASCKKIGSHEGRWTKLEEYFSRHAGVHFTHSFCPECEHRLYGAQATRRASAPKQLSAEK